MMLGERPVRRGLVVMVRTISIRLLAPLKRCAAAARRLARRNDGAAAVEFAIVAAPVLALLFAIMETGRIFFAGATLEPSAAEGSRVVMTGQAQNQNFDQAAFKNAVCARLASLFTCSNVMVDVRTYNNFSSANTALPVDGQGNLQNNFQ